MLYSVVIPCYNAEQHIGETIESVLRQRCSDFEVLVVDDASTDRTVNIANAYVQRDSRIKIIRSEKRSGGPATPRNMGIAESRGDYVAFLDADDIWGEDKLLNDARYLKAHRVDLLFSGAYYFRSDIKNIVYIQSPKTLTRAFLFRNSVPILTVCVRRELLSSGRLWFDPDPLLDAIEDYHFLLHAYLAGMEIACRPGIDAYYRMDPPSSVSKRHDFALVVRRLVYNLSKTANEHSIPLPTFLSALAASVAFFYLKRLIGRA
jgi:teichuronic acid biosynthesis glycosyltransferase TuaG